MMKNNSVATDHRPKRIHTPGGETLTSSVRDCKDGTIFITFNITGQWPSNLYLTAIEHAAKWKRVKQPDAKFYDVTAEKKEGQFATARMQFRGAFQK